jgi:hypothetical protein
VLHKVCFSHLTRARLSPADNDDTERLSITPPVHSLKNLHHALRHGQ